MAHVLTVLEAAQNGDRRATLEAMRDRTATAIDAETTSPRDLAALTRRLMEIMRDLEAIDAADEEEAGGGDDLDQEEEFNPDEDL